jgi:Flp pilus assembly protein TadD
MNNSSVLKNMKKYSTALILMCGLCLMVSLSVSLVDWQNVINEDNNQTLLAFDSATPPDNSGGGAKSNNGSTFKRIVTAPVRLIARLFRGNNNNVAKNSNTSNSAMKTSSEVDNAIEREAISIFDQAVDLHGKKQLDAAIAKLTAVVGMQPNNSEAYNLLGVCYDEKGQFLEAQNEYKKAAKLEPINARFLNNLGYSYYLAGNDKQAIKWYQKAVKFTPDDKRVQNNLGLAYGRKGDFNKAKAEFVKAVGEHGALLNMGYLFSQQGRYQQAIEQFEAALKLQPNSTVAMSNLAQVYDRVGRARDAEMMSDQNKKLANSNRVTPREQTAEKNQEEKEDEE